jgi:hypothetical protein
VDDLPFGGSGINERRVAPVLVRHLEEPLPDCWVRDLGGQTLRLLSLKAVVLFWASYGGSALAIEDADECPLIATFGCTANIGRYRGKANMK